MPQTQPAPLEPFPVPPVPALPPGHVDLHSTAGKVAMGLAGSQSGMVAQGPDSNWASGPSHQGDNRSAGVVPLAVKLGVPGKAVQGAQLEQAALGMVPRVQAWSVASGVVVPTALLARLICKSVTAGVQLERGEKRQEGDFLRLRSLARTCANTLPPPG